MQHSKKNSLDITASIVTYNNPADLVNNAIKSFLNTLLNVKIFISDNSEEDSLKSQLISDPRIDYQHNGKNVGFGAGHNLVLSKILDLSDFHVILNPDIEYDNVNLLEKMKLHLESDSSIGASMPKVVYPDKADQHLAKLLPNPSDLMLRRFAPFLSNKDFDLTFTGYNRVMNTPFISGCFMVIKTNVLKEIGLFDERYFMYCEDIDLSRRIHSKYQTIFYPEVEVIHHYAKGSYSNKKLLKIHISSAIKYFNKWGWIIDKGRRKMNRKALKEIVNKDQAQV